MKYAEIKDTIVSMFGCDDDFAFRYRCPKCHLFAVCHMKRKEGESVLDFENKWEQSMIKAYQDLKEVGSTK